MDSLKPMSPMPPLEPLGARSRWPGDLGEPSSTGQGDGLRFALFAGRRRLLIDRDGQRTTYDLGNHEISGVHVQAQSGAAPTLTLSGPAGPVRLEDLTILGT